MLLLMNSCKTEQIPSHTYEEKTIRINDNTNYYAIALPFDFSENDTYPVFMALHWGGNVNFQSGSNFLQTFALKGLDSFEGIIIAPSCPESSGWIANNSEQLILTLIDNVKTDYNIDTTKIIIGGYSMGGVGTWYHAVHHSDIFKYAVPISSLPPNYMRPIKSIIPTYTIHGESDELFSIQTANDVVREIKQYGNLIRLTEVKNATHYQTDKFIQPLTDAIEWVESKWDN